VTPRRLVVAGGGIAGLLAAAGCAPHVDEVVVVDGSSDGGLRPIGPPHAEQLHNVLTRGQHHLEELLPGFRSCLLSAGAIESSVTDDTHVFELGGQVRERPLGMSIWSAPWTLLWETARSLLPPNVHHHRGSTVDRVIIEDGAVRGAIVMSKRESMSLDAEGVVDATGYRTDAGSLLQDSGGRVPETTERRLDRWFVTIRLRRPTVWLGAPDCWMVFTEPPERHYALLSPFRSDEWVLIVSSRSPQRPPRDLAAIGRFLDELPGPPLRSLLEGAMPVGDPALFRRRTARWQHYEADTDLPDGFVPIGDSFAAINPMHGQGVGVAAWQASLLGQAIRDQESSLSWTRRYRVAAGDVVAHAWALDDVPVPLISMDEWIQLAGSLSEDADRQRRYIGLFHLVEPASALRSLVEEVQRTEPPQRSGLR
jgi:2-polyprenyl-6-methoxyphenol hydroxylase-like FAD-dependent oxidoreductase